MTTPQPSTNVNQTEQTVSGYLIPQDLAEDIIHPDALERHNHSVITDAFRLPPEFFHGELPRGEVRNGFYWHAGDSGAGTITNHSALMIGTTTAQPSSAWNSGSVFVSPRITGINAEAMYVSYDFGQTWRRTVAPPPLLPSVIYAKHADGSRIPFSVSYADHFNDWSGHDVEVTLSANHRPDAQLREALQQVLAERWHLQQTEERCEPIDYALSVDMTYRPGYMRWTLLFRTV